MAKNVNPEIFTSSEARRRIRAILGGAFSGPPTPLKEIPKKNGEPRSQRRRATKRRASSTAKSGRGAA